MVGFQTKVTLVFLGLAVLAGGAIAALQMGALALASILLIAQALFAAGLIYFLWYRTTRRLATLKKQVDAGGPVAMDGECAELAQAIAQKLDAQRAELASREQQMAMVLQAEARARRAAQTVLDDSPHGIALLSPTGRIELVNSRGTWFGLDIDKPIDAVPHAWLKELLAKTLESRQRTKLNRAPSPSGDDLQQNKAPPGAVQMFRDGQELYFLPEAHPLLDANGTLTGVILILADVTPLRQTEAPGSKLLSSFSHEIRTPMTSLQMSLYLLLDDAATRLTPRQLDLLRAARDDSDRLHRIVEEALNRWKNERETNKKPE